MPEQRNESSAAQGREYDVEVTVREHWLIRVTASSPAEARTKVGAREWTDDDVTPASDRVFTGLRVRRAES